METLVLDFNFQPAGHISWDRAITQWCKGKVEIIQSYEDRDIRSASFVIKMPAVVRELTRYRKKSVIKFSRENVYMRDKGRCQYCNVSVAKYEATYDHVVPRRAGGKTQWENIVIACHACNQKKGSLTPSQAGLRLLSTPVKPKTLPFSMRFMLIWRNDLPIEWKDWLAQPDNKQ